MSTPYQQQPYHPQQPPQAPSQWAPAQAQAPWAAQPAQAQHPQAQQAQPAQAQAPWGAQTTGHPQQYAQSPQQAYQAQVAQQPASPVQQQPWAQSAQAPPPQAQPGYAQSAQPVSGAAGPQATGSGFQQAASGYAAALTGGRGAGWMNSLVGDLDSEEPPAENLKSGIMLSLLSVPVGMVLAALVSYVAWTASLPKVIFFAPGAVAGFAAVWLFLRKVDRVSRKGFMRLLVVGAVAAVGLVVAAVAADIVYITGEVGSEYASDAVSTVLKDNVMWYGVFVLANFGGLFGALRTIR